MFMYSTSCQTSEYGLTRHMLFVCLLNRENENLLHEKEKLELQLKLKKAKAGASSASSRLKEWIRRDEQS